MKLPLVLCIAALAAGASVVALVSAWPVYDRAVQNGNQRLLAGLRDAFTDPLVRAAMNGDDLAGIDELRRLQKIPGVISARFSGEALDIQMSRSALGRERYRYLERALAITVVFALIGAFVGYRLQAFERNRWRRRAKQLKRIHKRHRAQLIKAREGEERRGLSRLTEALEMIPEGVVLLDARQRLIAHNSIAAKTLNLTAETRGRHWLDVGPQDNEWLIALKESLSRQGDEIKVLSSKSIDFLCFIRSGDGDTWIRVSSNALPAVLQNGPADRAHRLARECPPK